MTAIGKSALANGVEPVLSSRRQSVGDEVYEILLARLISLKIPPGARIGVDGLARDLGISQTPVRAALIRLEAEGLVIKTHLVGYSAAPVPSRRQFEEVYQMRELLEPFAAERAALLLDDAQRRELQSLAEAMATPSSDEARLAFGKFAYRDATFHDLIARVGGGALLADTLSRLHIHAHQFRALFHAPRMTSEAVKEHADILAAIAARDSSGARAAMGRHIRLSLERIVPIFDSLPE